MENIGRAVDGAIANARLESLGDRRLDADATLEAIDTAPAPAGSLPDVVTVAESARRLGLDKSVVSRQTRKLGVREEGAKTFSHSAYVAARGGLNPLMARNGGPVLTPVSEVANGGAVPPAATDAVAAQAASPAPPASRVAEGLAAAGTEYKNLQSRKLQLELDEKEGRLVSRAEVANAIAAASRQLRDGMLGLPARLAGDLAAMNDPAEVNRALDAHIRELLETMSKSFEAVATEGVPE